MTNMSDNVALTEEEEIEVNYYCNTFTKMLKTEMMSMLRTHDADSDGEVDEGLEKYACLRGCRLRWEPRGYVVTYTSSLGKPLKPLQRVILSRSHPLEDGFPDKVKVIEKNHNNIVCSHWTGAPTRTITERRFVGVS